MYTHAVTRQRLSVAFAMYRLRYTLENHQSDANERGLQYKWLYLNDISTIRINILCHAAADGVPASARLQASSLALSLSLSFLSKLDASSAYKSCSSI